MTDVVLFHHAQGLTDGVQRFAAELRSAGHGVTTPDLYDGRTFRTLAEGLGYAENVGLTTIIDRGRAAAESHSADVAYVGFSLGVLPAQMLTQTRTGARGAVLVHSCVPASEFGTWPAGVPVQVHAMDADAMFVTEGDLDAARQLVSTVAAAELFLYPGDQHLFADASLATYDAAATSLLRQRTIAFLDRLA